MLRNLFAYSKAVRSLPAITVGLMTAMTPAFAQVQPRPRVLSPVEGSPLVTLPGNTHPLALRKYDRGPVDDSESGRMLLVLKRSPEQQQELDQLLRDQQTVGSPNYHKWLTPEEFGSRFGVADADVQSVTGFLGAHGFSVGRIYKNKMAVEVSGTAGQMRSTFHTDMRHYSIQGQPFTANASDPQIPSALAAVVSGFASLNNIRAANLKNNVGQEISATLDPATHRLKPNYTYTQGTTNFFLLAPGDIQTIYDIPVATGVGAGGKGVTIGVVGDSQVNVDMITRYQTLLGYTGTTPTEIVDGNDPAIEATTLGPDATIAYEQLELINGLVPNANLNYYVSASTDYDTGLDFATIRAIEDNAISILSFGYQACEAQLGAAGNAFVSVSWAQAEAQGITFVTAAGDSGSAGCDAPGSTAASTKGLGVNGYASTLYNTAVGGTDFLYAGGNTAPYWNAPAGNGANDASAIKYSPEQAWNDSHLNPANINNGTQLLYGGGGGFSTAGTVAKDGVTPAGYPQPSWQAAFAATATTRAIPDVSLFAGNNYNNAQYAICAAPSQCALGNGTTTTAQVLGGTAGAAAVFSAIMAQVVNVHGVQGNAAPTLYSMFTGNGTTKAFHAVASWNNSMACTPTGATCTSGYLTTGGKTAYNAAATYNEATGLGSVDAAKLIANWKVTDTAQTTTTLALENSATKLAVTGSIVHGTPLDLIATVTGAGANPGQVVFETNNPLPSYGAIIEAPLVGTTATSASDYFLPGGSYNLIARYAGDASGQPSTSSPVAVTVTPEPSRTFLFSQVGNGSTVSFGTPISVTAEPFSLTNNNVSTPTGTLSVYSNGSNDPLQVMPLSTEGTATYITNLLPAGTPGNGQTATYSLIFGFSGDPSYQPSTSKATPYVITVKEAQTVTAVSASSTIASNNEPVTVSATVTPNETYALATGIAPTGSVSINGTLYPLAGAFSTTGQPIGVATAKLTAPGGTVTAAYQGDTNYAVSTGTAAVANDPNGYFGTTAVNLTSIAPATVATDGSFTVNFTATQTFFIFTGNGAGTVSVYGNGLLLGTSTLNGGAGSVTVNPGQSGYLNLPNGNITITAVFTPSNNGYQPSSATSSITITDDRTLAQYASTADFMLSTDTQTQTITPSSNVAFFKVQLTALGNMAGLNVPIALSCSIPNSNLTCSFGANSATIGTNGTVIDTLQISGFPSTTSVMPLAPMEHWWLVGGGTALGCLFMLSIPARRKGWQGMVAVLICTVLVTISVTGCGSNSMMTNPAAQSSGSTGASGGLGTSGGTGASYTNGIVTNHVKPATYQVLITGTATTNTTLTHNTTVSVVVSLTPAIANGIYTLSDLTSGADIATPPSGSGLILNNPDGLSDQQWQFTYQAANPGYYTIKNVTNGLYITDPGSNYGPNNSNPVNYYALQQAATNDGTQLWTLNRLEGGYEIVNASSGGVLDDDNFGTGPGTPLIVYQQKPIIDGINQTWYIK